MISTKKRTQQSKTKSVPWFIPIIVLGFWGLFNHPFNTLPSLPSLIKAGIHLTKSEELLTYLSISIGRVLSGLLLGGLLGILLGLGKGLYETFFQRRIKTIHVPINILLFVGVLIIILWFKIDENSYLFLVSLGGSFPIYNNTYSGVKTVDKKLVEMGKAYGLKRYALFIQIILPACIPSILIGIRYGLWWMWSMIIMEVYLSQKVDDLIINVAKVDVILFIIIFYLLLGTFFDWVLKGIGKRWIKIGF